MPEPEAPPAGDPDTAAATPSAADERPLPQQPISARGSRYYRSRRYIIFVAVLAGAAYFAYDGWKHWPEQNARRDAVAAELVKLDNAPSDADKKHKADLYVEQQSLGSKRSDTDIFTQKLLAIVLPFVALGFLAFILYRSRGQVRLESDTLSVPGHPPIGIDQITAVDGRLWAKKGIAYVAYGEGDAKGRATLDAFIYEPMPMDDIYEIIARRHGVWEATKPPKKAKKP